VSGLAVVGGGFVREQLRAPLTLVLLVAIPAFFVLIFAGVLGEFSQALGGTLQSRSATAISAGWAAAFLSGTLAFFQVSSSRGADRRLAAAGLGAGRVALARITAALLLGATQAANPVVASAVERIIPPARAAQGYATYQVAFALGFGAGGTVAGFLYDADPLLPFIASAALALPVAAIVAAVLRRAELSLELIA